MSLFLDYLWIAPHCLLAVFLAIFLRRKGQRRLPIFFLYVVFELVQFLLSVLIFKYFRSGYNWGVLVLGNGINSLLVLGVIYELANKLIFSRSSLGPVLRPIFYGSLAVLLLGSAAASGSMTNGAIKRVIQVFETLDFSSSLIEVGLLVVLLVFARTMHIAWGDWTVGIAVGFGVSACMDLASAALRWSYGKLAFIAVDITQMAAYHVCVLIWLIYLLLPERPSTLPPGGLQQRDLEKWNEEVEKILPKWYGGVRKKRVMVTDIMSMAGSGMCNFPAHISRAARTNAQLRHFAGVRQKIWNDGAKRSRRLSAGRSLEKPRRPNLRSHIADYGC
jgi:hypothetical protein